MKKLTLPAVIMIFIALVCLIITILDLSQNHHLNTFYVICFVAAACAAVALITKGKK